MFNAESKDSPLRNLKGNIYNKESTVYRGRRNFPEREYGNNRESPTFLQLPNIHNSALKPNIFNAKNLRSQTEVCYTPIMSKELIKFVAKPNYILKKTLDINNSADQNKSSMPMISPNISQSACLKNINEYNIRENYKIDLNRIVTFRKKPQKDYNCVTDKNIEFSPPASVNCEKWPLFYENYYYMARDKKAFAIKDGLFTKLIDFKLMGNNQQMKHLRNKNKDNRNTEIQLSNMNS